MFTATTEKVRKYTKTFVKWLCVASLLGVCSGVIGSIFHICIDYATEIRTEYKFIVFLLPLAGLLIVLMYKPAHNKGKLDTNRIIKSVQDNEKVPFVLVPLIFVSTVMTHLFGGSVGREGAALQVGGGIGYGIGRLLRLGKHDMRIVVMAGMSGVFTALFGTPLTAAVFAIEVSTVGIMHYGAFFPCVVSAVAAMAMRNLFGLGPVKYAELIIAEVTPLIVLKIVLLALMCGIVSILFCASIKHAGKLGKKYIPNSYIRVLTGGIIIVALTFALQSGEYNGAGMDIVERALGGNARPEAFALKILFTAITIAAGFKGGEIVPAFFVGSTFGCTVAGLIGLDPAWGAIIGFVALFCGVVNCPIAAVFLAIELFGGNSLIIFALVSAISYMMSGNYGLYRSQKIMYSKLSEKYVDINTH